VIIIFSSPRDPRRSCGDPGCVDDDCNGNGGQCKDETAVCDPGVDCTINPENNPDCCCAPNVCVPGLEPSAGTCEPDGVSCGDPDTAFAYLPETGACPDNTADLDKTTLQTFAYKNLNGPPAKDTKPNCDLTSAAVPGHNADCGGGGGAWGWENLVPLEGGTTLTLRSGAAQNNIETKGLEVGTVTVQADADGSVVIGPLVLVRFSAPPRSFARDATPPSANLSNRSNPTLSSRRLLNLLVAGSWKVKRSRLEVSDCVFFRFETRDATRFPPARRFTDRASPSSQSRARHVATLLIHLGGLAETPGSETAGLNTRQTERSHHFRGPAVALVPSGSASTAVTNSSAKILLRAHRRLSRDCPFAVTAPAHGPEAPRPTNRDPRSTNHERRTKNGATAPARPPARAATIEPMRSTPSETRDTSRRHDTT
jgi:hypothetical protein